MSIHSSRIIQLQDRITKSYINAIKKFQIFNNSKIDLISQKSSLIIKQNAIDKKIDAITNKLKNQNYIKKAPRDIVLNDRKLLKDLKIEQTKLKSIVSSII